jgi:outer membrane beta-barrel protein
VRIFLTAALLAALNTAFAQSAEDVPTDADAMPLPAVEPDLERREFDPSEIDSEDFEIAVYGGLLSIEDFGTNVLYGARFMYHVSEDWFLEASIGQSEGGRTSFENLSGAAELLDDDERQYRYYSLSAAYTLLPGESFVGRGLAFSSALYLLAGVGSTDFAGSNSFTAVVGAGYRWLASDWFAVHLDVRDHLFDLDVTGADKTTHNLELSIGLSVFF